MEIDEANIDKLKRKAIRFREEIENKVKKYSPGDFATFACTILNWTLETSAYNRWPPHFLLHAIEANCVFHRRHSYDFITEKKLADIINFYNKYYDPVAEYYLNGVNEFMPFFISMARQQFYVQQSYGYDDLGRGIQLFANMNYPKTEYKFKEKIGVSFEEWIYLCFAIFASVADKKLPAIETRYFTDAKQKICSDESIKSVLRQLSLNPTEVKGCNISQRNKVNPSTSIQHETYFQSIFSKHPLLEIEEDRYLAVHKQFIILQATEGIYDLCKSMESGGSFGNEFGKSFEICIKKLLLQFIKPMKIFNESQLQNHADKKVCDFIINEETFLLLIECKGTEYKNLISTEQAIKNDNSTKKISTGLEQITSTASQVRDGTYNILLGPNASLKPIISMIITYKHIYFANSTWYWDNIINKSIDERTKEYVNNLTFITQILSVSEFERFLYFCSINNRTYISLFEEKLSKSEYQTGEWISYLKFEKKIDIPFIKETYDNFFDRFVQLRTKE